MKDEYEQQPKVDEDKAEFGVKPYTDIQNDLHTDIMKLMKALKYMDISADDCMIVFGRVYSTYVLSKLQQDGKIKASEKIRKEIEELQQPNDFYDEEIRDKDLDKEEVIETTIKMIKKELMKKI